MKLEETSWTDELDYGKKKERRLQEIETEGETRAREI